jgi:hypothetical protein
LTYYDIGGDAPIDPFASELPDIDVEEDLKNIRARDQDIDKEVEQLGTGIAKLRDIAIDMGQVIISINNFSLLTEFVLINVVKQLISLFFIFHCLS